MSAEEHFQSLRYARMNARRMEHLAALALPLESKTVLEIGAGVGDLTSFFLDRDCSVTSIEPRSENIARFRERYDGCDIWPPGKLRIIQDDVYGFVGAPDISPHQIVFCYGLLYHLDNPVAAISNMASYCEEFLVLETCVSDRSNDNSISYQAEDSENVTNSITGGGCLPTRRWVFNRLREQFPFAYVPLIQPAHDQFRLGRTTKVGGRRRRAIFLASRTALENPQLAEQLPET